MPNIRSKVLLTHPIALPGRGAPRPDRGGSSGCRYPRAMTPGCTKESCHFRDLEAEFAAVGATRLGISADPVERQRQFSEKHGFDLPLLSDSDRAVARQFGVKRPGPLFNRRATFVIGADGRLLAEISSEIDMSKHADEALVV